ncbi:MAG: single-stranded-DNA-specific exonuclease RecJ, partial [Candidatus Spechtbacterales bacterium]
MAASMRSHDWVVSKKAPKAFFEQYPEYHPLVAQILWKRGVRSQKEVDAFFNPDYETDTHDPFLLSGMEEAVEVIGSALESDEHILIYGDYDADGVCASTVLAETLQSLGGRKISVYIPHRQDEGYGLNDDAVRKAAADGVNLIVTVDCGSTNNSQVLLAKELGMRIVVTDHHTVLREAPHADAFVNPHKKGDTYPFKGLSGTAVAFKVACALVARGRGKAHAMPVGWEKWLLDLVALSTITDVMPLIGENRALVRWGLFVLAQTRREGLRALMRVSGVTPTLNRSKNTTNLNPFTLGFALGPRLNAAGRMEHAQLAFDLLNASDKDEADRLAGLLDAANRRRQTVVRDILSQISEEDILVHPAVVVGSEEWPIGVLGIVAGRIADTYGKPAFIYQRQETRLVGSARTPAHIHTVGVLESCESVLEKFGGHAQAGGFTAALTQEGVLRERIISHVASLEYRDPSLSIDSVIEVEDISWEAYA